jgi:hypothetical protein
MIRRLEKQPAPFQPESYHRYLWSREISALLSAEFAAAIDAVASAKMVAMSDVR